MASYPPELGRYYGELSKRVDGLFALASKVKSLTNSPSSEVEVIRVADMAERVEVLVGPSGVAELIRRLRSEYKAELVPFRLADELLKRTNKVDDAILAQVLRASLAVMTPPCITAAPSEGISDVKVKRNADGTSYLAVYFAGPIRSAGGTELAGVVVLADYIRRAVGLERYVATEEEIGRFVEELRLYKRRVGRFQYDVPEELIRFALKNVPVEISGVATDYIPVPAYRDLPRVETPYIRGGALRVVNDGIIGRAKKVLRLVDDCGLDGWDWLREIAERLKKSSASAKQSGLDEVVGGRPVLSTEGAWGGFRIRYGRANNMGMSAIGLNPYTMRVLDDFVVTGTQLRVDYPGKGGVAVPVYAIEPPVVLLRDGSVIRVDSDEKLEEAKRDGVKVLFNGDAMISLGDCIENNVKLRAPGYCEEWWAEEVKLALSRSKGKLNDYELKELEEVVSEPLTHRPSVELACRVSSKLGVPLYPRYAPFWDACSCDEVETIRKWLASSLKGIKRSGEVFFLEYDSAAKRVLEKMLVEHRVSGYRIVLGKEVLKSLVYLFRPLNDVAVGENCSLKEFLERLNGLPYRPRMGSTIAARVGRPEKARQRKMKPPVHALFPVGLAGGNRRDLLDASRRTGLVALELVNRVCPDCGEKTWEPFCRSCNSKTLITSECVRCGAEYVGSEEVYCRSCGGVLRVSRKRLVDLKSVVEEAMRRVAEPPPPLLKGVRKLMSRSKQPEDLAKGVLRASLGLYVYKDGTVRFDVTNAPLTHFKPSQVGVTVEALRSLGYTHDIKGQPLVSSEQVLELMVQDVVTPVELAEHLYRVSKFIDRYLRSLGLEEYYKFSDPYDVLGHLIAVISPHTYGAVVCRVIGFTESKVLFAHPILHAAKRRDCDGDEDSAMLLLDVLLNFSRQYLPDRIGGAMDSPLLLTVTVIPDEVDEQAHNLDIASRYPLEFYTLASRGEPAVRAAQLVRTVRDELGKGSAYHGFSSTVISSQLSTPVADSSYKRFKTMLEKVSAQLELAERLAAVNEARVAERVMASHILPDIMGNMRSFFSQGFVCRKCGAKYRRPPFSGSCKVCGSEVSQTLYRGAIEKYLELAERLLERYIEDPYLREGVVNAIENVQTVFRGGEKRAQKQTSLKRFF